MKKKLSLKHQIIAVLLFLLVIFVGLFVPILQGNPDGALPVESIMLLSVIIVSTFIVVFTDVTWDKVFKGMTDSISNALPGVLILLIIGPLIAGFIMSGLMPMLVYYGIKLINPAFLYAMALILSGLFSIFTGTSWGSAATIGVVMMGIGTAVGAEPGIIAGAVIGGAYFGDKMSPLSDTTNIAAIASDVNLYDHVSSMVWTTLPATLIALVAYTILGFVYPPSVTDITDPSIITLLEDLSGMFKFNAILLIPLIIVVVGSAMKKPVLPVMACGAVLSLLLAFVYQGFTLDDTLTALNSGFKLDMVTWYDYSPEVEGEAYILGFFQRGGFWELGNLLPISISILSIVGVLNSIDAMPSVVNVVFGKVKRRSSIIISSLATAIAMIAMTANGIACSFVTASVFKKKYDANNISRRVLSRTTEDAGTLLEVLFPWTPAAIFFTSTLGVEVGDYLMWSIANWTTPIIAIILAITGIGTYKNEKAKKVEE